MKPVYGNYGAFPLDIWNLIFAQLSYDTLRCLVLNSHFSKIIRKFILQKVASLCGHLIDPTVLAIYAVRRKIHQVNEKIYLKTKQTFLWFSFLHSPLMNSGSNVLFQFVVSAFLIVYLFIKYNILKKYHNTSVMEAYFSDHNID